MIHRGQITWGKIFLTPASAFADESTGGSGEEEPILMAIYYGEGRDGYDTEPGRTTHEAISTPMTDSFAARTPSRDSVDSLPGPAGWQKSFRQTSASMAYALA